MTSPWPIPDYATRVVMCCLCYKGTAFKDLSKTPEGDLTDVCKSCRKKEARISLVKTESGVTDGADENVRA